MPSSATPAAVREQLLGLNPQSPNYATEFVEHLLGAARDVGASDVHLHPVSDGLEVRWRLDGVLQPLGVFSPGKGSHVVTRLKVLGELLTYRQDVPQEGRIRAASADTETRVSTFPTLFGERAVVRLFAGSRQFSGIADLGLPTDITARLQGVLRETSGALLVTGAAGCGKTTTAYAALHEIARESAGGKSVVTLEDPIESAVPGASQSQVNNAAGFDLATGLRSLMRQDPEVIFIGEIRDRPTAETVFQASLTGHLVLSTFHAGSAAGAISRLSDMGIEPYLLRSGILAILHQRLARRLCPCANVASSRDAVLGLDLRQFREPVGCSSCAGTGYRGRLVLAELLVPQANDLGRAILDRGDTSMLERLAVDAGMITRWQRALAAVEAGETSPAEIRRVLGFGRENS